MIGITGASGILGKALLHEFAVMGIDAKPIYRRFQSNSIYAWDLKDPIPSNFNDFDLIFHCAFSFSDVRTLNSSKVGVSLMGTTELATWGASANVRIINPSSVLAVSDLTRYGAEKRRIEQVMKEYQHINLRLGIVDSEIPLGIIEKYLNSSPLIPKFFVDRKTKFWISNLGSVAKYVYSTSQELSYTQEKSIYVVNSVQETLPEIIQRLQPNKKVFVINLPSVVLLPAIFILKKFVNSLEAVYDQVLGVSVYGSSRIGEIESGWINVMGKD